MNNEILYNAILKWYDDSLEEWDGIDSEEWIHYVCKEIGLTRKEYKNIMGLETYTCTEVCPHCDSENEYHSYNVDKDGYVVKCKTCGKEIFLCDECTHHEDNSSGKCDWNNDGSCFRGKCNN